MPHIEVIFPLKTGPLIGVVKVLCVPLASILLSLRIFLGFSLSPC